MAERLTPTPVNVPALFAAAVFCGVTGAVALFFWPGLSAPYVRPIRRI